MTANPTTPDPREALRELVRYVERNTCLHEETHRAGFIWTICDGCGRKWADDEGGFQPDDEPAELVAARAALATPSARQGGEVDGPLHMLIDYADMADETGYGTVSSSIVRDLVQQALSARPAAGDGEPVEWRYRYKHPLPNGGRSKWRLCDGPNEAQELRERGSYDVQPLYTAPPAREGVPDGVTGEQREAIRKLVQRVELDGPGFGDLGSQLAATMPTLRKLAAAPTAGEGSKDAL